MHKNDQIIELEKKIVDARNDYYNTGTSLISDDVYDLWVETLSKLDPENILLSQVGAEAVSEWIKKALPIPMKSLDKSQNPEQFMVWLNKYNSKEPLIVMEKFDGLSVCVEYKNGKFVEAITRGSGENGEIISKNVIKMKGIKQTLPIDFTGFLRGEILLFKEDHQKYFSDYSNPRNAASGISRRYDGMGCEHLTVLFYNVVSDVEFKTKGEMLDFIREKLGLLDISYYCICYTDQVFEIWNEYQKSKREKLPFELDGLVVEFDNLKYQSSLSGNKHHNFGQIAFKFIPEVKPTKLLDVVFEPGNSGRLTPVAILEPVSLAGTIVKRASLHNVSNLNRLGATIGSIVAVAKRNEIIPQIEEVLEKAAGQITYPKTCPICGTATIFEGEYLLCPNTLTCQSHLTGRLQNWVNTLNLLEWGNAIINNVVEYGNVKTIVDLYKLSIEDLEKLPRMGKKSATRAYNILHENKSITLDKLIGGLSINMIGETIGKLLIENGYDTIDKLFAASIADFEKINGLGPAKAKSLYNGLKHNETMIKELLKMDITIKENEKPVGGKLNGLTFVLTGTMTHVREELIEMIENNGGSVKGSVGKSLSYLVCEDQSTTKFKKATQYGIKIISEADLLDMIG